MDHFLDSMSFRIGKSHEVGIIERLAKEGTEGIILGCTEIGIG
jgi:aspartate/glutamate racemase